ncbi:MAG: UDP-N-acetylmuramoyl-tripeptide--D-alanyl-D-alanine ligase [Oscillospiraceae bacterium]|jgi:UDP-N-acetylmuramoyl-tripeptide--D-alanyl-D-alanine ligase|nr:UDP-N-acetylmuramoyl-tripeptide--D-alanyl-D-alanine ligase [Oscillospiraceae bacterium]
MDIFLFLSILLTAFATLFAVTRQFHMLQQSSYFPSRYMDWLLGALGARAFFLAAGYVLSLLFLFAFEGFLPLFIFSSAQAFIMFLAALSGQKRAKKRLVFTHRVIRLYTTVAVILFVPNLLFQIFGVSDNAAKIIFIVYTALLGASPLPALSAAVINSPIEKIIAGRYVNDARRILKANPEMAVIGITGSYGKTGTKYILGRILSERFNVLITPESYNTLMGVVRTIRERLKPGTEIFVAEMGAKNPGDIKEICDLVHPDMGIITSIGPMHLSTFKTVENIVKTKFELAGAVEAKQGKMYLCGDNEFIRARKVNTQTVYYGSEQGNEITAENIHVNKTGMTFDICRPELNFSVRTKLLGWHSVANILAAVAVALDLGIPVTDIQYAVSRLQPVPHRLELKPFINGSLLIDDAYNANPAGSLEAAAVLARFTGMKKIAVTPGLVELGEAEYEHNYNLGLALADVADVIFLVGTERSKPLTQAIGKTEFNPANVHVEKTFSDALETLRGMTDANTVVLFENDLPDNYER